MTETYTPNREIADKVANLEEFRGNSVKALYWYAPEGVDVLRNSKLPKAYTQLLKNDIRKYPPLYVVFSYETPIAWVYHTNTGGRVVAVIPPVKYSVTTTKAQSLVRQGLSRLTDDIVSE